MQMNLIEVNSELDIFQKYLNTPFEDLLKFQNLERNEDIVDSPQLIVGMCMDNRKTLRIPQNFAFVIRTAGNNMKGQEFAISYAVGVGQIKYLALIAHTDCGMAAVLDRKEAYISGLNKMIAMSPDDGLQLFSDFAHKHYIGNEVEFVVKEANRIKKLYPKLEIAPFLYKVENNKLYQIENSD